MGAPSLRESVGPPWQAMSTGTAGSPLAGHTTLGTPVLHRLHAQPPPWLDASAVSAEASLNLTTDAALSSVHSAGIQPWGLLSVTACAAAATTRPRRLPPAASAASPPRRLSRRPAGSRPTLPCRPRYFLPAEVRPRISRCLCTGLQIQLMRASCAGGGGGGSRGVSHAGHRTCCAGGALRWRKQQPLMHGAGIWLLLGSA